MRGRLEAYHSVNDKMVIVKNSGVNCVVINTNDLNNINVLQCIINIYFR